jgi:uncharacterized membrane protein
VVKGLHSAGIVGTYDAAVVDKDLQGKVYVHKHEKPTQHGAWSGLAVGALLGILFPPGIIAGGIVGAAAGGVIGHLGAVCRGPTLGTLARPSTRARRRSWSSGRTS